MRAVILAAGCGSRMGDVTEDVPKAFLEVGGRTLYDRQREVLTEHVDGITIVLGYKYENVVDDLSSADPVVFERWSDYENAESLRRALERVDDEVLVLNGDVVVEPGLLDRLVDRYRLFDGAVNVVGCFPGVQDEHTAIQCDGANNVVDYGMIPGHRHAGVGIISRRHRDAALDVLADNSDDWYPHVYPETPTKRVTVSPNQHVEINRPSDLATARERFPLARPGERDTAR